MFPPYRFGIMDPSPLFEVFIPCPSAGPVHFHPGLGCRTDGSISTWSKRTSKGTSLHPVLYLFNTKEQMLTVKDVELAPIAQATCGRQWTGSSVNQSEIYSWAHNDPLWHHFVEKFT